MTILSDNIDAQNSVAQQTVASFKDEFDRRKQNRDSLESGDSGATQSGAVDPKADPEKFRTVGAPKTVDGLIAQQEAQPYSATQANTIIGLLAAKEQIPTVEDGKFHWFGLDGSSKEASMERARKKYFAEHDKRDAGTVTGDIMHQLGVDKMDAAIQKQVHDKLMVIAGKKDGLTELKEIDLNLQGARAGIKGARPVDEEAQDMRDHLDVAANGQYGHDFKDALKPVAGQHVNPADRLTLSVVKAVMSYAGSGNAVNPETGAATETYSVKDAGPDVKRDPSVPVINWADPAAGQPGGAPAQQPGQQQQQGQPGQNGQPGQPAPVAGGNGDGAAHFASGSGQLSDDDKKAMDAQIDAKIATLKAGDTLDFTIVVGHDATGSKRANLAAMKARQAAVEAEVQERLKASHKDVKVAAHVQQVDPEKGAKGEDAKMRFAKIQFGQP